jgi:hypothetical protein
VIDIWFSNMSNWGKMGIQSVSLLLKVKRPLLFNQLSTIPRQRRTIVLPIDQNQMRWEKKSEQGPTFTPYSPA